MISFDTKQLDRMARKHALKFVILHGSHARGRSQKGSDIDIAVVEEKPMSFHQEIRLRSEFAEIFGDTIEQDLDVKSLHKTDPFFRFEVVRDGILLFGDPTEYEFFKSSVYLAHEDAKPLRELERVLSERYQRHLNTVTAQYAES